MRGERNLDNLLDTIVRGSSPRARGTPSLEMVQWSICRFIPACAGNARLRGDVVTAATVHPRMRGERADGFDEFSGVFGSSPHARGTPGVSAARALAVRFIPACAGNAVRCNFSQKMKAVHPRMRGERSGP